MDDSRTDLVNVREMPTSLSTPGATKVQARPRRKRGDTIRASDYMQPNTAGTSSSGVDTTAQPSQLRNTRSSTRRTRSGTVTLSNPGSISTLGLSEQGRVSCLVGGLANPTTKGRRRKLPPTIKMKIDDDPLRLQSSDDEDDELLLTGEIWRDE